LRRSGETPVLVFCFCSCPSSFPFPQGICFCRCFCSCRRYRFQVGLGFSPDIKPTTTRALPPGVCSPTATHSEIGRHELLARHVAVRGRGKDSRGIWRRALWWHRTYITLKLVEIRHRGLKWANQRRQRDRYTNPGIGLYAGLSGAATLVRATNISNHPSTLAHYRRCR